MDRSIKRSKLYIILAAIMLIAIVAIFLITLMLSVLSQIMGFTFPDVLNSAPFADLMTVVLPLLSLVFSILAVIYSAKAKKIDRQKYSGRLVAAIVELCLLFGGMLRSVLLYSCEDYRRRMTNYSTLYIVNCTSCFMPSLL